MTEDWRADWDEALKAIKQAERHLHKGEREQAEKEAWRAVCLGQDVMRKLFTPKEIERIGLFIHVMDSFERAISAQDCVNGAKKVLLRFINLSPREKLWGKDDLK